MIASITQPAFDDEGFQCTIFNYVIAQKDMEQIIKSRG